MKIYFGRKFKHQFELGIYVHWCESERTETLCWQIYFNFGFWDLAILQGEAE